jgi:hypothetical protein
VLDRPESGGGSDARDRGQRGDRRIPDSPSPLWRLRRGGSTACVTNPEDDEYSRLAIAGFSSVAATDRWSYKYFTGIRDLRATELSDDALAWHAPHAQQYARFACMCYGALFALRDIGALKDEDDFEIAEAVMPGFMMAHLEEIYRLGQPS